MKTGCNNSGSVFILVVFVIAMLSALVVGIAQINTEEIQIMRNHLGSARAFVVAEAGLNDALARLRSDSGWTGPITDELFAGGSYDVAVEGGFPEPNIVATGTSPEGFVTRLRAQITIGTLGPPHVIRINKLRINE